MPDTPPPELLNNASQWQQYLLGIGVVIGGAYLTVRNWAKGLSSSSEPARQIVLESAQIADMAPFRESASTQAAILMTLQELTKLVKDRIESEKTEDEIERRAQDRAQERFEEMMRLYKLNESGTRPGRRAQPRAKT